MRIAAPLTVLAAAALFGCGPGTLWSSAFPLRYAVSTRLTFAEGADTVTQEVVSACELVDQTDSIAANVDVRITTERHGIRTADGGFLLFADIQPCRWFPHEERPAVGVRIPLVAASRTAPEGVEVLRDSEVWWFDDPTDPARMEVWHSDALFAGIAPVRVGADIGLVDAPPSHTLAAAFPWMDREAAARAAADAAAVGDPDLHPWTARPRPWRFEGVTAEAWRLERGARCVSVPEDAAGPAFVSRVDDCRWLPACADRGAGPCRTLLGGLPAEVTADAARVGFRSDTPRPGWVGVRIRRDHLPSTVPDFRLQWAPEVCVDGLCKVPDPPRGTGVQPLVYPSVYLPASRTYVELSAEPVELWNAWLVKTKGPTTGP